MDAQVLAVSTDFIATLTHWSKELNATYPLLSDHSREVAKAMQTPDMAQRIAAEGSEAVGSSPKEFEAHIRAEQALWSRVIKQAGIKGE